MLTYGCYLWFSYLIFLTKSLQKTLLNDVGIKSSRWVVHGMPHARGFECRRHKFEMFKRRSEEETIMNLRKHGTGLRERLRQTLWQQLALPLRVVSSHCVTLTFYTGCEEFRGELFLTHVISRVSTTRSPRKDTRDKNPSCGFEMIVQHISVRCTMCVANHVIKMYMVRFWTFDESLDSENILN